MPDDAHPLATAATFSTTSRPRSTVSRTRLSSTQRPPTRTSTGTANPVRASTTGTACGEGGDYVVAVIQNKTSGVQVGVAAMNCDTGRMTLTQITDTPTYTKTIHYLTLHPPSTILVLDNHSNSYGYGPPTKNETPQLVEELESEFQLKCHTVPRGQWNPDNGLEGIKRLCIEDDTKAAVLGAASDSRLALCACAALLHWTATEADANFCDNSLRIQYETIKGHMFIDSESARNLELVRNNLSMKPTNTLYSTLNSCTTPMGMRLLRSSILQPSNRKTVVTNRLDVVEELMSNPAKLTAIRKCIKALDKIDFDRLITSFSRDQRIDLDPGKTEYRIGILLQLRKIVGVIPDLCAAVQYCDSQLLVIATRMLSDPLVEVIAQAIDGPQGLIMLISERIADEATLGGKKAPKRQMQKRSRLYAVKGNFNQLLDLARSTYEENVQDIVQLNEEMEEQHDIPTTLEWNDSGFRFSCPTNLLEDADLPADFINVERGKKVTRFTSHELLKRNARMLQTQQEVFLMSDTIISELVDDVIGHISEDTLAKLISGGLYACSEAIALLDLLSGFATKAQSNSWVRPQFGNAIIIKNGRHPVLESIFPAGDCVPNDVFAASGPSNFQLIQGPNMSGKSTYLREIGLLTVQAMVGSYIPAEHATLKLHDALLTRLSNDDSMEKSLSTFAAEMATSAMILGMATDQSLILIDELGRGTSPIEGVGLAQAIAEQLIKTKSFVFFATHFQELALTLCTYPGVVTLHLHVQHSDSDDFGTTFHYKVVEGASKTEHYGLELAKLASLPPDVMDVARAVSSKLTELEENSRNAGLANAQAQRRKVVLELRGKLLQVMETSKSDDPGVVDYLRAMQKEVIKSLQDVLDIERGL